MTTRRDNLRRLTLLSLSVVGGTRSLPVGATAYLEPTEALKILAPAGASFERANVEIDASTLARIAAAAQRRPPRGFRPDCWIIRTGATRAGWVVFDRVVGKYELIDYAVGFASGGEITGVEILAYRESHGAEIRNARWRGQFVGRAGPAQIRFEDDIRNITGATLSSRHITEGVQRLSALVSLVLNVAPNPAPNPAPNLAPNLVPKARE